MEKVGKYFNWRIVVVICSVMLSLAIAFHGLCVRYTYIDNKHTWNNVKVIILDRATGRVRVYAEFKNKKDPEKRDCLWFTLENIESGMPGEN